MIKYLPIILLSGTLCAQERTTASGGDISSASGSVSFTIGLPDYVTLTSSGTVSQGVQQPYEFFSVGIEEWDQSISLSVFPNPATEQLTISFQESMSQNMRFILTDDQGKLVREGKLETMETFVDVRALATANYFLTVYNGDQSVRTYKLIKH